MNNILNVLNRNSNKLIGRISTDEENFLLTEKFSSLDWFASLNEVLKGFALIGMRFDLSNTDDSSGSGVRMKWMTPKEQIEESFDFYPGLVVLNEGFLPIGICMVGSGDPYFLRFELNNLNVYRVSHEYDEYCVEMLEYVTSLEQLFISNLAGK